MLNEPLAFFLTWTTYGTWLPGDDRGWVRRKKGFQEPQRRLRSWSSHRLQQAPCTLTGRQRQLVDKIIRDRCELHRWKLFAVNVRTNHVHVVVAASNITPSKIRDELKARCSARLRSDQEQRSNSVRKKWWTERGSQRFLNDEESLEAAIRYVNEAQDKPRE